MATTRDDMNAVCRTATDLAFERIAKRGGFIPFAVVIAREGDVRFVALGDDLVDGKGERGLATLRKRLRAGAKKGEYKATAIASDVRVRLDENGEVTDAIRIEVEHVEDEPITCCLPYRRKEKAVEQHIDPYLEPGDKIVFAD